jgi:hypothetical protein
MRKIQFDPATAAELEAQFQAFMGFMNYEVRKALRASGLPLTTQANINLGDRSGFTVQVAEATERGQVLTMPAAQPGQ